MALRPISEIIEEWRNRPEIVRTGVHGIDLNNGTGWWYEIDWCRLRDEHDLLGWIIHLSAKNWVTPEHIELLIRHAHGYWGRSVPGCP